MKPKHQRFIFVLVSLVSLCIAVLFVLQSFRENLVFFFSPSELAQKTVEAGRKIRIGGLVETGSIKHGDGDTVTFVLTDGAERLTVQYRGLLPNLFREGQGVVAEGSLVQPMVFEARTILAKHDETYIPREVVDSLKRSGHWKGEETKEP